MSASECCYLRLFFNSRWGEVFPIYLANELKKAGIAVTFVDFRRANYDEGIRKNWIEIYH